MTTTATTNGVVTTTQRSIPSMDLIDAHLTHLRSRGFSHNTVDDRLKVLRRVDRELPMGLKQATVEELENWLARPSWSNQTQATYYAHIVGFFAWAGDPFRPLIDWNPATSLRRPKVPQTLPRPVSTDELTHILRTAKQPWRLIVTLAAFAGLRCCELATLRREDVTSEWIIITGKGGKTRPIPTHPPVWEAVRDRPRGLLADGLTADQVTRSGNRYIRKLTPDSHPPVTMHRFRHWFATWLLRPVQLGGAGAELRTVQELLGHSSPASTAIYTQITDEQRQMAIAALPVLPIDPTTSR